VACVLILAALFRLTELKEWFQLDHLRLMLNAHRAEGVAVFVALFILGNLLHIPGLIFLISAVVVLGRLEGGLATYVAASLSCAITFLLVRWAGGNAMEAVPGALARRLLAQLHRFPLRNTVLLRTLFQTMPTLNYALALSGMRFRTYMLGTLIGLPLPIAAYCFFFDAIATRMHLTV
jgi:uncharacterized membrane protein YdjX (TVP38/TMEM64 family)